jgi:hypothetical protein
MKSLLFLLAFQAALPLALPCYSQYDYNPRPLLEQGSIL